MSFKKNIAKRMVDLMGKQATIAGVHRLSPHLLKARLAGDAIEQMNWSPGDKVKLHVGGGLMRSYTPSKVHAEEGWMEIIFHLHGNGPASDWASQLQGGEQTTFLGPATSMKAVQKPVDWAFFFGDETTIGLAQALYEDLPHRTSFLGFIELDPSDVKALDSMPIPLHAIQRNGTYGAALLQQLDRIEFPEGQGIIYLSGEASSVLALRNALLTQGIERKRMHIKPYWSCKGKAHRKQLERNELRS